MLSGEDISVRRQVMHLLANMAVPVRSKLSIALQAGGNIMNISWSLILTALLAVTTGCYLPITGRVIDAETRQPIEGAVIMVEWTKTHGLGEHWTESYKVVEAISEKDGTVKIGGCYYPFVNAPNMVVYKKGYAAWNNDYIFPKYEKRTDFKWGNGYVFRLNKFLNGYSYVEHQLFIDGAAHTGLATEKKKLFMKTYGEGEDTNYLKEQRDKNNARGGK